MLKLLTPVIYITLCIISTITQAKIIDPPYTIERAIHTIKINADASSLETNELTTLINTQQVANSGSDDQLTFSAETESIKVVEAYTLLPNGKRIDVSKNNIHIKDAENNGATSINDSKIVEIIYPNVVVGSKTHYKAVKTLHKASFKNQYDLFVAFDPHPDWRYVEYNIQYPKSLKLYNDIKDLKGGRIIDAKNGQLRYQYTYTHPQELKVEDNEISYEDYARHLHFTTLADPIALATLFENAATPKAKVTPEIQVLADSITKGIDDDYQQAKAIYNWVSKEIRYVSDSLGEHDYTPHEAIYTLDKRFGDCKDHNNLLITLLKAKHIEASSALINSDRKYKIPTLGSFGAFNHVITYLPKWQLYVDTTTGLNVFGILVESTMDKPTLLTALKAIGHTKTFNSHDEQSINHIKLDIQPDGTIKGTHDVSSSGSKEFTARNEFESYEGQNKEVIENHYFTINGELGTGSFTPTDVYDLNTPFKYSSEFILEPVSNMPGNGAMTVPYGLANSIIHKKSVTKYDDSVEFPFVCRSYYTEDAIELNFPSNVKVTKLPQAAHFNDNGIEYNATYQQDANKVNVKRNLTINKPSAVCNSKDYETWLALHRVLVRDLRGQIIYE